MDIARGPAKKGDYDEKHEYVANVSSAELKRSIDSNGRFRFNITKVGYERQAVCTAKFTDSDLAEITRATARRFELLQNAINLIEKVNESKKDSLFKQKSINDICWNLKYSSKLPEIKLD